MPVKPRPLPPTAELHLLFRYEPETGAIYSKTSRTNRRAGERCDRLSGSYLRVYVKRLIMAHRVAWKIYYHKEPPEWIDHINGNRLDNRIANLRGATHPQNMCNRKVATHSKSCLRGISQRENGKWRAYRCSNGRRFNIGTFPTKQEAIDTLRATRKLIHGEFPRD